MRNHSLFFIIAWSLLSCYFYIFTFKNLRVDSHKGYLGEHFNSLHYAHASSSNVHEKPQVCQKKKQKYLAMICNFGFLKFVSYIKVEVGV